MNDKKFEFQLTVPADAIDVLGHVNNVKYLDWIQIVAIKHWNHCTRAYFEDDNKRKAVYGVDKMAWMVTEHNIRYHGEAYEGDELTLTTYVRSLSTARSELHTMITKVGQTRPIVDAVTMSILMKMPEGRPMAVPEEIKNLLI